MRIRPVLVLAVLTLSSLANAQAPNMSESEKKSTARVAFTDGLKLQDDGKPAEALAKFELAQKYYDAPTHLLHIAECQALTGKLVESAETYETLLHRNLGANPPEAFTDAQEHARAEITGVKARTPTLKITTKPDATALKNLQVTINNEAIPADVAGLARPVNPGKYKIAGSAQGYKLQNTPQEFVLAEKETKVYELAFVPGQGAPVVVAAPPPPNNGQASPPPPPRYEARPEPPPQGPSSTGLLLGIDGGVLIPGGGVANGATTRVGGFSTSSSQNFGDIAAAGGEIGVDAMARLARMLLLGARLELGALGGPNNLDSQAGSGVPIKSKVSTFYIGATVGILPNVDKTTFYGQLGLGYRHLGRTLTVNDVEAKESLGGAEAELQVGLSIPVGPVRIVPKFGVNVGTFSSVDSECAAAYANAFRGCIEDGSTDNPAHIFVTVGLGLFYHLDLAKKVATAQ